MRLNKKQKSAVLVYFFVMLYLLLFIPFIISLPCGCTFRSMTWIWEKTPLLFDFSSESIEEGDVTPVEWSIDWRRIALRISFPTLAAFSFIVWERDKALKVVARSEN
jgi:hypothetical protein